MIGPPGWNDDPSQENLPFAYLAWSQPDTRILYYLEFTSPGEAMAWGSKWCATCRQNKLSEPPFTPYTVSEYVYTGVSAANHYDKALTLKDFGKRFDRELDNAF